MCMCVCTCLCMHIDRLNGWALGDLLTLYCKTCIIGLLLLLLLILYEVDIFYLSSSSFRMASSFCWRMPCFLSLSISSLLSFSMRSSSSSSNRPPVADPSFTVMFPSSSCKMFVRVRDRVSQVISASINKPMRLFSESRYR